VEDLIPKGIAVLQYVDDTIIFLKYELEKARNMKILMYMFEQMSGLKNNFEKSEIVVVGNDDSVVLSYADAFNCQIGIFPLSYLGVPVSASRLHVIDWCRLEENMQKKLDTWQGSLMSSGSGIILTNSSLSNTVIYHMSVPNAQYYYSQNGQDQEEILLTGGANKESIMLSSGQKSIGARRGA
jgi:hypothetical protein